MEAYLPSMTELETRILIRSYYAFAVQNPSDTGLVTSRNMLLTSEKKEKKWMYTVAYKKTLKWLWFRNIIF